MRAAKLLLLVLPLFFAVACKDKEDLLPLTPLEGVWDYSQYNSEQKIFFIYRYEFFPDGTFERSILIREADTTKILGYYSLNTGTYELRGESYIEQTEKRYVLPLDAYVLYVQKENLLELEVDDSPASKGTLIFSEVKKTFELIFECNDTPSARVENCIGSITYKKVN